MDTTLINNNYKWINVKSDTYTKININKYSKDDIDLENINLNFNTCPICLNILWNIIIKKWVRFSF